MRSHEADVEKMNRNLWRKSKGSCEQNEKESMKEMIRKFEKKRKKKIYNEFVKKINRMFWSKLKEIY